MVLIWYLYESFKEKFYFTNNSGHILIPMFQALNKVLNTSDWLPGTLGLSTCSVASAWVPAIHICLVSHSQNNAMRSVLKLMLLKKTESGNYREKGRRETQRESAICWLTP